MNFAVTGKRIVSTQPQKKLTAPVNTKVRVDLLPKAFIRHAERKPSLPINYNKTVPKVYKKKEQQGKQCQKKGKKIYPQAVQVKSEKKLQHPPQLVIEHKATIEKEQQQQKIFEVMVRYNHYQDKFPTGDNVLRYQVIQKKYGFAAVFKGNYLPRLQVYRDYSSCIQPLTSGTALEYSWEVQENKQYEITIIQDEQQESKHERKVYMAPKEEAKCPFKRNKRFEELTRQMKAMSPQQFGSQKHRQLLEQRALQQVLFS